MRIWFLVAVILCAPLGGIAESPDQWPLEEWMQHLSDGGKALNPAPEGAPADDSTDTNHYEVYMDVTQSMRPFLNPRTKNSSAFRDLLTRLANIVGQCDSYAFGIPSNYMYTSLPSDDRPPRPANRADAAKQPPPWKMGMELWQDPKTYDGLNNEYAPLIEAFPKDDKQRLVITDGVISPKESLLGSNIGTTAADINKWLDSGGIFGLFLFRTPYYCSSKETAAQPAADETPSKPKRHHHAAGETGGPDYSYFSETRREQNLGTRVAYDTDARPFVVFAFMNSDLALHSLKKELTDGLEDASRAWSLEVGTPATIQAATIEWDPKSLDPDEEAKALQKRISEVEMPDDSSKKVKVVNLPPDMNGSGELKLAFQVKLASTEFASGDRQIQYRDFKPSAELLEIPAGKPAPAGSTPVHCHYDTQTGVIDFSIPQVPKDGRHRLWYVRLAPLPSCPKQPYDSDVSAWSTIKDDTADVADRTLNLQPLVTEIARGRSKANPLEAAILLITD